MSSTAGPVRILHCHSTFAPGGKELRSVALMNALGGWAEHAIVSAEPEQTGARAHIDRAVAVRFLPEFPSLKGLPTPGRLVAIAKAMKGYDLVLTYNWGAMDAVMAHTVFGAAFDLPPLIHHEDGFNEDEAASLKTRRNVYRRIALGRSHALVVPSRTLETIARERWNVPANRIVRIANGIETGAFGRKPRPGAFRVVKREGECWIGTLAGLRAVKQLPRLVEACANLPENWHLVIVGDGPERDAIRTTAEALEVSHRVHLPGAHPRPHEVIGLFDIFALSSRSEQFPLSVVEAMAAGLPVAAPDVGDVKEILAEANRPYVAVPGDTVALAAVLGELAEDEGLRAAIGKANRVKARANYDVSAMVDAYRDLYSGALGGRAGGLA
ncbi:glycosyltransferase family 4 protein [Qipengyuania nanhaisediminis]|uniref:glycosyltransferase family 4 protein n=1 Tax=Qipengyuania nanhaisediminis TaxID=604088 RepID=UPI0038B2E753